MTLKALYYFKKLAEVQHFSKAANELYISQPTLSYTISELEKELGTELFHRKNKNILLNEYGVEFLKCTIETLNTLEKGINSIKKDIASSTTEVRIGFIQSFGKYFISDLINNFYFLDKSNKDSLKFSFIQKTSQELESSFSKKEIDILFNVEKSKVGSSYLFNEQELHIVAHKNHPLVGKKIKLKDLRKEKFILINSGTRLRNIIDSKFLEASFTPQIAFEMNNCGTIVSVIEKELGISIIPVDFIKPHEEIAILDVSDFQAKRPIYVSWNNEDLNSYKLKNFKSFIFNSKD